MESLRNNMANTSMLNFILNPDVLVLSLMRRDIRANSSAVAAILDRASKLDENMGQFGSWLLDRAADDAMDCRMGGEGIFEGLPEFLNTLQRSREYGVLLSQTRRFMEGCKRAWETNLVGTTATMSEITGIDFGKSMFRVYITHPDAEVGKYMGSNAILWGNGIACDIGISTGLWHEIMHSVVPADALNIGHAVIELVTDNELAKRMNKHQTFTYPPFRGWGRLAEIKQELLPKWEIYLRSGNKSIMRFYRESLGRGGTG